MSKPQFGEPWRYIYFGGEYRYAIYQQLGVTVANAYDEESAKMIVNCLNACSGLTDEQLKRVRAVNELYESCRNFIAWASDNDIMRRFMDIHTLHEFIAMNNAVEKAEGKEGE